MKTFFTLLFGGLMTVSAYASDVTLTFSGNKNYQVLIDGRSIDLTVFSSENHQLELAKQAYKNTVDKQNFRKLYDSFSYNAQADLNRYTRYFR